MNDKLEDLRNQIDNLDYKLLTILAKRVEIVRKIGQFKRKHKISVLDEKRWQRILKTNLKNGEKAGFSQKFITGLFGLIHKYSLEIQKKVT